MNMTVVLMSNRLAEFMLLASLMLLATLTLGQPRGALAVAAGAAESEAELEAVGDERKQLNDDQLGTIVRDFGGLLKETMEQEMERLISEMETTSQSSASGKRGRQTDLAQLREANKAAGEDIQARIELAGDNKGALPQMGLGGMATSFAAAASGRLTAASSYIGNKMRSLGHKVKARIPAKLRRFFKWPTFLKFKIRFHKNYKSLREELYRQMIFLRTHIVNGMQHMRFLLGRDSHLNGANQYSDWTAKEYAEKEGNHEAERSAADLSPAAAKSLDAKARAKLEALASEGKNIFGQNVPVASARGHQLKKVSRKKREAPAKKRQGESEAASESEAEDEAQPQAKRQRRERRSADEYDEMADDELDESESEDFDSLELANDLESDSDSDNEEDSEELFQLVDEFANEIDMSGLDDIESNVDDALNANDNFKPIDLRETGCILKAENQNGCGCCYSYATHSAASYYNCVEKKLDKPERYHARFAADCGRYLSPEGRYPAINSCRGGRISVAFTFVQLVGVQMFAHYNIARVSAMLEDPEACVYPRPADMVNHGWKAVIEPVPMFKRSRFTMLKPEEVELHLRTVGPVVINVRTWKNFKDYEAGILDNLEDADASEMHSMLIVGRKRDARGRDYWIILNSHGIVWGENGFLRVYVDALKDYAVIFGGLTVLE